MELLIALVAGLFGLLLIERSKKKSSEGLNENVEVKKELSKLDVPLNKNKGLLEAEEEKRKEIKNEESKPSLQDVADFLNDRK